jgi:hypothetical protein
VSEADREKTGFEDDGRSSFGRPDPSGKAPLAAFLDSAALLDGFVGASALAHIARIEDRVAASRARGISLPFADALDSWSLTREDRLLVGRWLAHQIEPATDEPLTIQLLTDAIDSRVVVERLASGAPLDRCGLLVVDRAAELPWVRRSVRGTPRLLQIANGIVALDATLDAQFVEAGPSCLAMDPVEEQIVRGVCKSATAGELVVVASSADPFAIARRVATTVGSVGRRLLVARASRVRDAAVALAREALLFGAVVLVIEDEPCPALVRQLSSSVALIVVGLPVARPGSVRCWPPPPPVRLELWRAALGATEEDVDLHAIAATRDLDDVAIGRVVDRARAHAGERPRISRADLVAALRAELRALSEDIAYRLDGAVAASDLIVPSAVHERLTELVDHVRLRHRVRGDAPGEPPRAIVALFVGVPGTGKSLAAQLIAHQLLLDCFEVNLHRLVATWSAQTEQDFSTLAAAVDAGHVLLKLDGAETFSEPMTPAITAVANWLARSRGVVILSHTTSFVRLERSIAQLVLVEVAFPFPDEKSRAAIWRRHLSEDCDVDPAAVSSHPLSGRDIRNVIDRATVLAAARGARLCTATIVRALALRAEEGVHRR